MSFQRAAESGADPQNTRSSERRRGRRGRAESDPPEGRDRREKGDLVRSMRAPNLIRCPSGTGGGCRGPVRRARGRGSCRSTRGRSASAAGTASSGKRSRPSDFSRLFQRAASERRVCTTPFGWPVVPEVKRISASSPEDCGSHPSGFALPGPATGSATSTDSVPRAASFRASSSGGGPSQAENRGAAEAARVSTSNAVSLESIGAAAAPRLQIARSSTKNSRLFPKWRNTRSRGPSPRAR